MLPRQWLVEPGPRRAAVDLVRLARRRPGRQGARASFRHGAFRLQCNPPTGLRAEACLSGRQNADEVLPDSVSRSGCHSRRATITSMSLPTASSGASLPGQRRRKAHPARIAIGPGRWTVTGHLGQALPAISSSGSLEITLTDAPQYLLPAGSDVNGKLLNASPDRRNS